MDKANGDTFIAFRNNAFAKRVDFRIIERLQYFAVCADTLIYNQSVITRNKRRRKNNIQIILFKTAFGSHFDNVAEAFGCHECGFGSAPLNEGVGGKCRAVNNGVDLTKLHSSFLGDLTNSLDDGVFRKCIIRQYLGRMKGLTDFHRHISKGSANIDTNPDQFAIYRHVLLNSQKEINTVCADAAGKL